MNLIPRMRRHLMVKLFLSYLLVILIGVVIWAIAAELAIPNAFDRHMVGMMGDSEMMGGMGMMQGGMMGSDLFDNFRSAVGEALIVGGSAAFVVALGVSFLVSRRVVAPLQEMTAASRVIADGHYEQRVKIPSGAGIEHPDELDQLSLSFNMMAEKLHQTENMRRQLIGDVTHELRTPLTTIKGSMEGLLDGVLPPTPETFENIHREASRLQRLVDDLQELSRVESGAMPMEFDNVNMREIAESVARQLKPQFSDKSVTLELNMDDSLPRIKADPDRLSQVLINLLGNALQYTPENGKVVLSAQLVDDIIKVSVTDSGIGIPAEHLPHIFTRFYRVDKSRSRAGGGSGIGLTIAKHIVEAHGGNIWAESEGPGRGSTFVFTIPVI